MLPFYNPIYTTFSTLTRDLLHDEDISEARLALQQAVDGGLHIRQGVLLNHALDAVGVGEANSLLTVEGVAGRPSVDASALEDETDCIEFDGTDGGEAQQLASGGQTGDKAADNLGVGSRLNDDGGATELLELRGAVVGLAVNVVVGTELLGKLGLVVAGGEDGDLVAHLVGVLDSEMAQTAEALDGDEGTLLDAHLADAVEDGDTGAEERRGAGGLHLLGDADDGLGTQQGVLGVAAVLAVAVDLLVLAHLELTALALAAGAVVAAVPGAADALAGAKGLDAVADGHNVADNLVARGAGEDVAHLTGGNGNVGEADTAGEDLDEDLAGGGLLHLDVLELKVGALFADDDGLVSLG